MFLPGNYFITIDFRTDDPRFSFTDKTPPSETEMKKLCGILKNKSGWSNSPIGIATDFSNEGAAIKLSECVFSIPTDIVSGIQFSPDGYPAIDLSVPQN